MYPAFLSGLEHLPESSGSDHWVIGVLAFRGADGMISTQEMLVNASRGVRAKFPGNGSSKSIIWSIEQFTHSDIL